MPTAPDTVTGSDIVTYALAQRGKPYVWGQAGPKSYDCSGLVFDAYRHAGLSTPRTTGDMIGSKSNLQPVTRGDLQAGDLIFSNWTGAKSSHVGIYTGNGSIIEAPEPGKSVMVTPLNQGYWSHVDNLRRVPGIGGAGTPPAAGGLIGQVGDALAAGASAIAGMIPNPGNVTEALSNVGTAIGSVAESAVGVANVANLVTRAFLPSNLIRGSALVMGSVFILIGIWFLGREIKDAS